MTSLVVRKVISGGVVKLERVKGYCAVAKQRVDFPIETQLERKEWWQNPAYRYLRPETSSNQRP